MITKGQNPLDQFPRSKSVTTCSLPVYTEKLQYGETCLMDFGHNQPRDRHVTSWRHTAYYFWPPCSLRTRPTGEIRAVAEKHFLVSCTSVNWKAGWPSVVTLDDWRSIIGIHFQLVEAFNASYSYLAVLPIL